MIEICMTVINLDHVAEINLNLNRYKVFATRKEPRGGGVKKHPRGKFAISRESNVRF